MHVGQVFGSTAKRLNRRFGILAWLQGEPRPPAGGFDLQGEKEIDWGWICVNLPPGPKRALEIGCGKSPIIPAMLALGYEVVAVDLLDCLSNQLSGLTFLQGDFNVLHLDPGFDVIVACSTVEHIGLSGRFGSPEDENGDIKAMQKIAALIQPHGIVLLTIPMGSDGVHKPWHRVYGRQRAPRLLNGFDVVNARFLVKEPWEPWQESSREAALDFPASIQRYALGEFI